ncbi:MAG: hypothetical protein JXA42_22685 [Anaerolineales bacterium]|nr:hypothetical protein [Anaerolineales bacterium]
MSRIHPDSNRTCWIVAVIIGLLVITVFSAYAQSSWTDGQDALYVIGQPDLTSTGAGTTINTFFGPFGLAVDSSGRLWVADLEMHAWYGLTTRI